MLRKLLSTNDDRVQTVLRIVLGVVFLAHGGQMVLGWFGGSNLASSAANFIHMGIPAPLAYLAILAQFLGGIGLMVGLLGRIAAFGIACDMLVAIFAVHLPNGIFMNWAGSQKGEGFEYHLLALALCAAIMIKGSGAFSLDGALHANLSRQHTRSPLPAA
jgi:putative oxidoreductase